MWLAVWRGLPRPSTTPFTFGYLALLFVSTAVLLAVPERTGRTLLDWSSTDAYHLRGDPLRVLVSSALWLPNLDWLGYAAMFSLVLAPVERRVGSPRTLGVFAAGHVIATLVTEVPIVWAVSRGYLPRRAQHRLDVGVSYGFYAVLGVGVGLLPRRARVPAGLAATMLVGVRLVTSPDLVAAVGHVVALVVGFGCWWWARPGQPRTPSPGGAPAGDGVRPADRSRRRPGHHRARRTPD